MQLSATFDISPQLSLRDAVSGLMYGIETTSIPPGSWTWSPLTTVLVMHAISIQLWHISQATELLRASKISGYIQDYSTSHSADLIEFTLKRCHTLVVNSRHDEEPTWTDVGGPLLFNCLAILRVSYARAFTGARPLNRMILLEHNQAAVFTALREFIQCPQSRNAFITKAAGAAVEGFFVAMNIGVQWVQKAAALTWSIEHALAGWDSGKSRLPQ